MCNLQHVLGHDGAFLAGSYPKISPLLPKTKTSSSPNYLWIDCSDNDFTVHDILGLSSDELIVYRNLAHQINYTDLNCLSVLQYAIQVARIKHVIVCGHSNCALLRLSIQHTPADLVENWLSPLKFIYQKYEYRLELYQPESLRLEKFCELNVIEQVFKLCYTTVIQNAWKHGIELIVHGWIYSAHKGLLKDLAIDIQGKQEILTAYRTAITNCIQKS